MPYGVSRRIVCASHPGGPFVIHEGVEPVVESECAVCRFGRQAREKEEAYRRAIRWQRSGWHGEAMTAEEAFKGMKGE